MKDGFNPLMRSRFPCHNIFYALLGSSQKVQVLWLLFYKAAESGVKGHSLPLPEFAATNHDHENAALYLEEITKR